MGNLRIWAAALIAVATMAGAAGATTLHLGDAPRMKPVLIQSQCPAGYHWQAEGYTTNGKYRPAECVRD